MYYVNANYLDMERVFPEQGRDEYLKLDMNENVDGLPKSFVKEFVENITPEFVLMYPEPKNNEKKYAEFINVNEDEVMATNGSDVAIRYAFETFGEVSKTVVTVTPSFEMYRINASLIGMNHKAVGYREDYSIDVDEIVKNIDENTRIVVLLNPNNPIGNVYEEREVRRIIEKADENGAVVIIDEAYHYFCDTTFVDLIKEYKNVMIFRTFSKLFAMAACRLGVIVSNTELIHWLKKGKLTFDVNSFALKMGEMILDRPEIIANMIDQAKEGKSYLVNTLETLGYRTKWCEGNFIFFYPKSEAKSLAKKLKEAKILVKTFSVPMLKDVIRVTTASKEVMSRFVEVLLLVDIVD